MKKLFRVLINFDIIITLALRYNNADSLNELFVCNNELNFDYKELLLYQLISFKMSILSCYPDNERVCKQSLIDA